MFWRENLTRGVIFMKKWSKIGLIVIVGIPLFIFVRAQLIYQEGPRIIKQLEAYKIQHDEYPEELSQVKVASSLGPRYIYNKEKDEFILMYPIFSFARWYYDSSDKQWKHLD
jgi:hypothetical protein